jgi:hypothetical protein
MLREEAPNREVRSPAGKGGVEQRVRSYLIGNIWPSRLG